MTRMNEKTYEMWEFPPSKEDTAVEGWFDVDEVIAPVIQELNLRGYRTTFCCSGHPTSGLLPMYYTDKRTGEIIRCQYMEFYQTANCKCKLNTSV